MQAWVRNRTEARSLGAGTGEESGHMSLDSGPQKVGRMGGGVWKRCQVETQLLSVPDPRVGSVPPWDGRFRELRGSEGGVRTGANSSVAVLLTE